MTTLMFGLNLMTEVNVPKELEGQEVPYHSKYVVALTHLIYEGNPILDKLVKDKWNELVESFELVNKAV